MTTLSNRTGAVIAAAVIGTLSAAASAQPNLVVNGGFETGGFFPWTTPSVTPPEQGYFEVAPNGGHFGPHFAAMSSSVRLHISQNVATTAGNDYLISFWMRRSSTAPDNFFVRWEGATVFNDFIFNQDFMTWYQYSVSVHANLSGSRLEFGQDYFPLAFHLDDVSVTQAPAPSAAAVLGMAAMLGLGRRRRRGGAA